MNLHILKSTCISYIIINKSMYISIHPYINMIHMYSHVCVYIYNLCIYIQYIYIYYFKKEAWDDSRHKKKYRLCWVLKWVMLHPQFPNTHSRLTTQGVLSNCWFNTWGPDGCLTKETSPAVCCWVKNGDSDSFKAWKPTKENFVSILHVQAMKHSVFSPASIWRGEKGVWYGAFPAFLQRVAGPKQKGF